MKYKEFSEVNEQSILDNCPKVIGDIKKEFGLMLDDVRSSETFDQSNSFGESRGVSRVLTKDGNSGFTSEKVDDRFSNYNNDFYGGGYSINGDIRKTSGTSYVLVVAALIALVILVYVVSTTIMGMIDIS